MTAGDLITKDHQYEYNGVLMGSGTDYMTIAWDGLFDPLPDLRTNDLDRNDSNGTVPGLDLTGGRQLAGNLHVLPANPSDVWARLVTLSTAFLPRQTELPFCFRHPATGGQVWQIMARPRKYAVSKTADLVLGDAAANCLLYASKPQFYNRVVTTSNIGLGSAVTDQAFVINPGGGNWPTGPTITITGPLPAGSTITVSGQTPIDGVSDNGKQFVLTTDVAAGSSLVIDMKYKTVTLDGTKKYSYKASNADWWRLYPGNNTVTVHRPTSGAALTATIAYSQAWMI